MHALYLVELSVSFLIVAMLLVCISRLAGAFYLNQGFEYLLYRAFAFHLHSFIIYQTSWQYYLEQRFLTTKSKYHLSIGLSFLYFDMLPYFKFYYYQYYHYHYYYHLLFFFLLLLQISGQDSYPETYPSCLQYLMIPKPPRTD